MSRSIKFLLDEKSMGYQLNKPDLRREMETECNKVANGQKRKEEIMQPILSKMMDCFTRVNTDVHKLDEAIGRYFSRIGSNDANSNVLRVNFSVCGGCRNPMTLKQMHGDTLQSGRGQNRQGTNRARTKVLYCSFCSLGLTLPRGVPSPLTKPDDSHPVFLSNMPVSSD